MKKYFVKLLVPIMSMVLVWSCSKDSLNQKNGNLELGKKSATTDYLDEFYDDGYTIGDAIETTDNTGRTFNIFPITLSGDSISRGYIAVDVASGDLVYFADVDRVNYVMITEDIEQAEINQYDDINNHDKWESTNGFDFSITIGNPNGDPGPPHGRKFWGKDKYDVGPCLMGQQLTTTDYYVLWIKVSSTPGKEPC